MQKEEQKIEVGRLADFVGHLIEMNRGNTVIECGRKLTELSDAIIETGGKGKLTLTLELTPSGLKNGRINQIEIRPEIKIIKPDHVQGKSVFFVTEDGTLTRRDPDQMDMDFDPEEKSNGRRT